MKMTALLALLITLSSAVGFAADATTATEETTKNSASMDSMKQDDQKLKDIDSEITNPLLRATLGSKSRWSFRSDINYDGGSFKNPFGSVRPNIVTPGQQPDSVAALSGSVGFNYRASESLNINGGATLAITDPLHGDWSARKLADPRPGFNERGNQLDRVQVNSPFVGFSSGYKVMGLQMATEGSYIQSTDNDSVRGFGRQGYVSLQQTLILNPEGTSFSGGVYGYIGSAIYGGNGMSATYSEAGYSRDTANFGLIPFAEYQINDTFGLRTVFNWGNFYYLDGNSKPIHQEKQQSAGLAVSVSRDIYVYPNIQFIPDNFSLDRSNVGVRTIINL